MSESFEISVCVDCVAVDANGHDPEAVEPNYSGWLSQWDGYAFSIVACGGDDVDDLYCEGHFLWSPCDGCGSGLGGDRFCYSAVSTRQVG
jgi:hypothetical protein